MLNRRNVKYAKQKLLSRIQYNKYMESFFIMDMFNFKTIQRCINTWHQPKSSFVHLSCRWQHTVV